MLELYVEKLRCQRCGCGVDVDQDTLAEAVERQLGVEHVGGTRVVDLANATFESRIARCPSCDGPLTARPLWGAVAAAVLRALGAPEEALDGVEWLDLAELRVDVVRGEFVRWAAEAAAGVAAAS